MRLLDAKWKRYEHCWIRWAHQRRRIRVCASVCGLYFGFDQHKNDSEEQIQSAQTEVEFELCNPVIRLSFEHTFISGPCCSEGSLAVESFALFAYIFHRNNPRDRRTMGAGQLETPADDVAKRSAGIMPVDAPSSETMYYLKQWWKDVKNCVGNVGIPTLLADLNPIPGPDANGAVGVIQGYIDSQTQAAYQAAAAWSVSRGLTVPLRSSIVRAGLTRAEGFAKVSDGLLALNFGIAAVDLIIAEARGCQ